MKLPAKIEKKMRLVLVPSIFCSERKEAYEILSKLANDGDTVVVPIPDVDRTKADFRVVLGRSDDGMHKIGTKNEYAKEIPKKKFCIPLKRYRILSSRHQLFFLSKKNKAALCIHERRIMLDLVRLKSRTKRNSATTRWRFFGLAKLKILKRLVFEKRVLRM